MNRPVNANQMSVPLLFCIILLSTIYIAPSSGFEQQSTNPMNKFKAAVYAHVVFIPPELLPVSREKAFENMEVNLAVYREQTAEASKQGAHIIVFPEDGVYGMKFENKDSIYSYLEYMPDPKKEVWNPCDEPSRYNNTEVQQALSCMAKQNGLYLVANIGDKQPCDKAEDPKCPSDGRYQYNTDVAYSRDGTFLAKYHKHNLFYEDQFDTPDPEYIYFDTPFGRFGMMTCFDVMFKEPAVTLVEKYNITNMAFPTAWMDALPLLPALGFHSSFARAHKINYLSANIHLPLLRFTGTGLYAPEGARAFYYSTPTATLKPKLLVAEMDVIQKVGSTLEANSARTDVYPSSDGEFSTTLGYDDIKSDEEFHSDLFYDVYTFRMLTTASGKITVCQNDICCHLEYEIDPGHFHADELFAVGAFDGIHTDEGKYYMQNCALVKCANPTNKQSCGDKVFNSTTVFTKILLRGQLQAKYVYPQIILSDALGQLALAGPGDWDFAGSSIQTRESFNSSVLNAILIGRDYSRDSAKLSRSNGNLGNRGSLLTTPVVCLILVIVFAVVVAAAAY